MPPALTGPRTQKEREYLDYALDRSVTDAMASVFGNPEPAPAKWAGYDHKLLGSGVIAYYVNPEEVVDLYPEHHKPIVRNELRKELGTTEPYIGLNPGILRMPKEKAYSVIDHEKSHGAQPKGKLALKGIYAVTPVGKVPLGEMLIEGWNEYGLERSGRKPPSRYLDEDGHGKALYSHYRDFVYEVEQQSPGITRQIMRSAKREGPNAAMRLIESVPGIDKLATKYASKLNNRMN